MIKEQRRGRRQTNNDDEGRQRKATHGDVIDERCTHEGDEINKDTRAVEVNWLRFNFKK